MRSARPGQPAPGPLLVAAALTAAEALALLAVSVVYVADILTGKPSQRGIALFGAALGVALALTLGGLALGLARARRPALSPVVLVQLLMLPVGWGLVQGRRYVAAVVVIGLAVSVLATLFGSERSRASFR